LKIRLKLTLQFSVLVAFLLLGILSFNYIQARRFARESFFDRLRQRAMMAADRQLDQARERIRHSSPASFGLPNESYSAYSKEGKLLFHYGTGQEVSGFDVLSAIRKGGETSFVDGELHVLAFPSEDEGTMVFMVASATDVVGSSKVRHLAGSMVISFLIFLVFVVMTGQYLAKNALDPIESVISQVKEVSARSLDRRVKHPNNSDEIAQLAQTFNSMLERLETSFKTQSDFVRNSSHELRNPLAAMIGQAEIALNKDRDAVYYKEVVQAIYQESLRLKHIVNSLLHLSKASPETVQKTHEILRLDELLLDVVENQLQSDSRRKIQIALNLEGDREPCILGSRSLLEVAIGNLLDNACKFSEYQTVRCTLERKRDMLEICIQDSGIGMSEEEIRQISEPFFRSANVRDKEGFGIGMAVANKVFQVHGTEMIIRSQTGKGSQIHILFPEGSSPRT
jgi:signal transduction histidine kinase